MKLPTPLSLQQVASLVGAEIIGDPQAKVHGINEIHMVEPGDLTFVDHPKYYNKALNSGATFVLINARVDRPEGKHLLFSSDPFRDYVFLARYFRPFEKATKFISDTAEIGEGTIIQPGAFIGHHVKIGKNCVIHANVSIYDHVQIGDEVIIHSGAVLGADAYYFQKRPEGYRKLEPCGNVIIGNRVEIGACCCIDRGVSGNTIISDGTKMDNQSQVGHDTYIGKNCLIGAQTAIAGVTRIEDDVLIWARVVVNKDIVIGKGAVILATSGVDKSLKGGKTYFGSPVDDVRKKWREQALLRRLPELFSRLDKE
ncbi:MAG: UDP-3-O-(3-hydroxymyristoyl)glucosamine N-acyltransferase [Bacteroidetes bacterium]|nr:UDP-3-O-(3-hydroxymyristoyl)glucosamine N-acyltransferase [Bacteroidota bacterium]